MTDQSAYEPLEWDDAYEIGSNVIDREHMMLFATFDDFNIAANTGMERGVIRRTLEILESYTLEHFGHEEEIMVSIGYPDLDAHREEHRMFIKRLDAIVTQFDEGEDIKHELRLFIRGWLVSHILASDQKIGRYIKSKNQTLPADERAVPNG